MPMLRLYESISTSLLEIKAVSLRPDSPFTWTSGLKSPIYCDNRLTMSYPQIRNMIAEGFVQIIRMEYPDVEVVAGTATAGIPHAAWVADKLNLPMIYIRDKAKGHGKGNQIEGVLKPGQKVIVIEDLISTGGSSLKAALAARDAGGDVQAVLAIFTYEFPQAQQLFTENEISMQTLTTYSELIDVALKQGYIEENTMDKLKAWRENPAAYE